MSGTNSGTHGHLQGSRGPLPYVCAVVVAYAAGTGALGLWQSELLAIACAIVGSVAGFWIGWKLAWLFRDRDNGTGGGHQ